MFEKYFDQKIQPQETVVATIRPSIWHFRRAGLQTVGLLLIACLVFYPAVKLGDWALWLVGILTATGIAILIRAWLLYQLTVCLLTTHRLIDITRDGLWHEQVAELALEHIQDVRYNKRGLLATLCNFGTVTIQATTNRGRFELPDIPKPAVINELVLKVHRQYTTDTSFIQVRE